MKRILVSVVLPTLLIVGVSAQAPVPPKTGTEKTSPREAAQARNLIEDVTVVGCIRAWTPAPDDPAKQPTNQQPGVPGVFLLTPVASNPATEADLPTYLLTPSATISFAAHVDRKVEIAGTTQAAPLPPTVQEIATAPTQRPENKPNTQSMPRLTVRSLKRVADGCP